MSDMTNEAIAEIVGTNTDMSDMETNTADGINAIKMADGGDEENASVILLSETSATEEAAETDAACRSETDVTYSAEAENPSLLMGKQSVPTAPPKGERLKLVLMLVSVIFATVGVIVWGSIITEKIALVKEPIASGLLRQFLGRDVTSVGGTVRPSLNKIPSKPVEEGDTPGAAEDETVQESGDAESGEAQALPVRRVDLSVESSDVFALINETPYTPDVISLYARELKTLSPTEAVSRYGADAPRVLVLHTHGTESYFAGGDTYSSDEPFRTYDTEKNVVAVGRAFAERLREHGIGVIHIETMFDGENYNEAYVKSAAEVRRIIEKYPSVEYVFDIHRDAMFTHEGVNLAPTSPLRGDEGDVAQIMLVVGTDHAGAPHGDWEDNLSFALKLQKSGLGVNGGLMRGINLRSASFNAQYAKGAVLLEIGAAGNTLDEAIRAGELFADGVAEVVAFPQEMQ